MPVQYLDKLTKIECVFMYCMCMCATVSMHVYVCLCVDVIAFCNLQHQPSLTILSMLSLCVWCAAVPSCLFVQD